MNNPFLHLILMLVWGLVLGISYANEVPDIKFSVMLGLPCAYLFGVLTESIFEL